MTTTPPAPHGDHTAEIQQLRGARRLLLAAEQQLADGTEHSTSEARKDLAFGLHRTILAATGLRRRDRARRAMSALADHHAETGAIGSRAASLRMALAAAGAILAEAIEQDRPVDVVTALVDLRAAAALHHEEKAARS